MKIRVDIKEWGHIKGTWKELGACAGTVAWLKDNKLFLLHAGDTFAVHIPADYDDPSDYRALTTEHAIGNGISRYFGQGDILKMDAHEYEVDEGDIIVLFSDGVIKSLGFRTIAEAVREWMNFYPNPSGYAAKQLCNLALKRGSSDDITALIIEIEEMEG